MLWYLNVHDPFLTMVRSSMSNTVLKICRNILSEDHGGKIVMKAVWTDNKNGFSLTFEHLASNFFDASTQKNPLSLFVKTKTKKSRKFFLRDGWFILGKDDDKMLFQNLNQQIIKTIADHGEDQAQSLFDNFYDLLDCLQQSPGVTPVVSASSSTARSPLKQLSSSSSSSTAPSSSSFLSPSLPHQSSSSSSSPSPSSVLSPPSLFPRPSSTEEKEQPSQQSSSSSSFSSLVKKKIHKTTGGKFKVGLENANNKSQISHMRAVVDNYLVDSEKSARLERKQKLQQNDVIDVGQSGTIWALMMKIIGRNGKSEWKVVCGCEDCKSEFESNFEITPLYDFSNDKMEVTEQNGNEVTVKVNYNDIALWLHHFRTHAYIHSTIMFDMY